MKDRELREQHTTSVSKPKKSVHKEQMITKGDERERMNSTCPISSTDSPSLSCVQLLLPVFMCFESQCPKGGVGGMRRQDSSGGFVKAVRDSGQLCYKKTVVGGSNSKTHTSGTLLNPNAHCPQSYQTQTR